MFEIGALLVCTINFIFLVVVYDKLSNRVGELEFHSRNYKRNFNDMVEEQPQYNESVDPVTLDAETHDYLVRLAKEERE